MICLFDIDGTLLSTGGAGQRAMENALATIFGIRGPTDAILAAGRTDRAITVDLFAAHTLEMNQSNWDRFTSAYFECLPSSLGQLPGRLLPGVLALLQQLAQRDDVELGLLTGNFEKSAWQKLKHYQIDHFFDFGGFGDHHSHRDDVARDALAAVHQRFGAVSPDQIWVIGDTPADVQCGRAIGARVAAVATGIFARPILADCQPDLLFDDLTDPQSFLRHASDTPGSGGSKFNFRRVRMMPT